MTEIEKIELEARKKAYPLLPFSQLVWQMQQYNPKIYSYLISIVFDTPFSNCKKIKDAFRKALLNHPISQTKIDDNGLQHYSPYSDILHSPLLTIDLSDHHGKVRADIQSNRILGDTISNNIFTEDFFRAYLGKPLEKDYYFAYLQMKEERKQTQKYQDDRLWLEQHFSRPLSVHPVPDLPLEAVEQPVEGTKVIDYTDLLPALNSLAETELISHTAFFSLAAAMAIMNYNGIDEAALTWAYDGRETEIEQHICGSLHRDIPFVIKASTVRANLFRQVRQQMHSGIAHSGYPYTLTPPNTDIWNFAVNVIFIPTYPQLVGELPFDIEVLPIETTTPRPAAVLLDIEIYEDHDLQLLFRYSASHYSDKSINHFCHLLRQNAEWLLKPHAD